MQGVSARLLARLPACLPTWMTRYPREQGGGGERRKREGRARVRYVVGLYRKDTIRGDLILAPVYEYTRRGCESCARSEAERVRYKKDLQLIIISRRDAGADISRGNHCGIRSNERALNLASNITYALLRYFVYCVYLHYARDARAVIPRRRSRRSQTERTCDRRLRSR